MLCILKDIILLKQQRAQSLHNFLKWENKKKEEERITGGQMEINISTDFLHTQQAYPYISGN